MRSLIPCFLLLFSSPLHPQGTKALVGGRLIDGYGGPPLDDTVVLIEGERITAVGRLGELEVPRGAEVISTEGMSVLPGLWDMHVHLTIVGHSNYGHWDRTYPRRFRDTIMARGGETAPPRRSHERPRPRSTSRGHHVYCFSRESIAATASAL
jgi:hypothetical protein